MINYFINIGYEILNLNYLYYHVKWEEESNKLHFL